MPSPFPGMDPWLEHPALWPDVHQRLITYAADVLNAQLGAEYFVAIGERVYVEVPARTYYPDVSVIGAPRSRESRGGPLVADAPTIVRVQPVERREPFLELRSAHGDHRVVTVIEVLSPANKRPGAGRELYVRKQADVLASDASLVEIDLLRAGEPTVALPEEALGGDPYRVVVSRPADRTSREVYAFALAKRMPRIRVPLSEGDDDAVLDLGALLADAYERGGYARRVDYTRETVPALGAADLTWARGLLAP